jgi:hypothetical protein
VLGEEIATHRMGLLAQIIRLLLTMIPNQRAQLLREEGPAYHVVEDGPEMERLPDPEKLSDLPNKVPLP